LASWRSPRFLAGSMLEDNAADRAWLEALPEEDQ
jgi:hypothetical protein